jgi:hypothetical protein
VFPARTEHEPEVLEGLLQDVQILLRSMSLPGMPNCSLEKTISGVGFQTPKPISTLYFSPVAGFDFLRAEYWAAAGVAARSRRALAAPRL